MADEGVPRKDFIRLGAVLGLGVAGSTVLGACGGGNGGAAQGETTQKQEQPESGGTTSPTVASGDPIVAAAFLPPGFAFPFNMAEDGRPAVLVHLPDESWVAYSAVCTHKGCEVAYQIEAQQLGCPCHGSVFDPADGGAVVDGPAEQPLEEVEVRAEGDQVIRA